MATEGIEGLTDREKDVLRLLSNGHTAKSAAAELDLSVHTVNDYLREARKKLGVGSSREAARLLADSEATPENLGPQEIGMANDSGIDNPSGHGTEAFPKSLNAVLIAGGFIMLAGALALALFASGSMTADHPTEQEMETVMEGNTEAERAARDWVKLVDESDYEQSWTQSSAAFRSAVTADQWAAQVEPVRNQIGAIESRTVNNISSQTNPPGAPAGDYRTVIYDTTTAKAGKVVETVVMMDDNGSWKAVGYFVRPSI